jgi:hypothetical protein
MSVTDEEPTLYVPRVVVSLSSATAPNAPALAPREI